MRKLADLFADKRVGKAGFVIKYSENMREEDHSLVEDLMRDARVNPQVWSACEKAFANPRIDRDIEFPSVQISLGATAIESKIKVVVTLLKDSDENDLKISLFSLTQGPAV